ncbi:MAG TPA: hypothetical protein VE075_10920, partial [Thermoanaerobaculia bacterium]|nr:hypothetical protein [Thermoanaerobaculia bacterium]
MKRSHLVLTAGIALSTLTAHLAGAATIAVENLSSVTIAGTIVAPSCSYDVAGLVLGSVDPGQMISRTASFGVAPDDCVAALQDDSGVFEDPFCSASTAHLSSPSAPDLVLVTYTSDYSGNLACAISFALSAPTQLSATAVGTARIVLTWGSSEVTGFNVYRKSGVGTTFARVGSTAPGVVIFNDLSLAASTTYT